METVRGQVRGVHPSGIIVTPLDEYGNRILRKPVGFHDDDSIVEEVDGEPLF